MKYLLITLLVLFSCGGNSLIDKVDVVVEPEKVWEPVDLSDLFYAKYHADGSYYGGAIDNINDNSWVFTSSVNNSCPSHSDRSKSGALESHCRYGTVSYTEGILGDNVETKVNYEFVVLEYNIEIPSEWVIVFEQWTQIADREIDNNGNHPISTLKLKTFDGKLYIAHYDNAWQWGYDHGTNSSDTQIDIDHDLHQKNRLNGYKEIEIGVSYNIEIVTYYSGRFIFKLNGETVSDTFYKTKSDYSDNKIMWGQYLSKGYNVANDPLYRVVSRVDNFKISLYDHDSVTY